MGDINPAAVQAAGGYAGERLTDSAIAHRQDVARQEAQVFQQLREVGPAAPHPDDLFIHIAGSDVPDSTTTAAWLKFKAEVLNYVAGKLKDLGT